MQLLKDALITAPLIVFICIPLQIFWTQQYKVYWNNNWDSAGLLSEETSQVGLILAALILADRHSSVVVKYKCIAI